MPVALRGPPSAACTAAAMWTPAQGMPKTVLRFDRQVEEDAKEGGPGMEKRQTTVVAVCAYPSSSSMCSCHFDVPSLVAGLVMGASCCFLLMRWLHADKEERRFSNQDGASRCAAGTSTATGLPITAVAFADAAMDSGLAVLHCAHGTPDTRTNGNNKNKDAWRVERNGQATGTGGDSADNSSMHVQRKAAHAEAAEHAPGSPNTVDASSATASLVGRAGATAAAAAAAARAAATPGTSATSVTYHLTG